MMTSKVEATLLYAYAVIICAISTIYAGSPNDNDEEEYVRRSGRSIDIFQLLKSWIYDKATRMESQLSIWENTARINKRRRIAASYRCTPPKARHKVLAILAFSAVAMQAQAAAYDHGRTQFDADSRWVGVDD
jgi:hypothetical protein